MTTSTKQPSRGFFDEYEQLEKLSKLKDPLEKLNRKINFESASGGRLMVFIKRRMPKAQREQSLMTTF